MMYRDWVKKYVRQAQKPKYYEDHYFSALFRNGTKIPIELVIKTPISQSLPVVIRESI